MSSLGPLRGPVASVAVGVVLCLPLIEPTRFYLRRAESQSRSPAADVRGAIRWLEENTAPEAVVMSHSLSQSAFSTQRRFMVVPWNRGVDTVLNVIDRFDVRYVVVGPRDRGNRPWVDSCWASGSRDLTGTFARCAAWRCRCAGEHHDRWGFWLSALPWSGGRTNCRHATRKTGR